MVLSATAEVNQEMPDFVKQWKLGQCQRLKDLAPLTIPTDAEQQKGSFREQWRPDHCAVSIQASGWIPCWRSQAGTTFARLKVS